MARGSSCVRAGVAGWVVLACGQAVLAQAFNVSFGTGSSAPVPSPTFGAAAGASGVGVWNGVRTSSQPPQTLMTATGGASGVTAALSCAITTVNVPIAPAGSEFARLMGSGLYIQEVENNGQPVTSVISVTFRGLSNGTYTVYVYACDPTYPASSVGIFATGGAGQVVLSGPLPAGTFVEGVTHAVLRVNVSNGVLGVSTFNFGPYNTILNGIQLIPDAATAAACSITQAPVAQTVLSNQTATFGAAITGDIRAYRWTFNGTDLSDIRGITGSQTPTLTLAETRSGDAGVYALRYLCGGEWKSTVGTSLTVLSCPADFNRSGAISVQDLFDFLAAWFQGC